MEKGVNTYYTKWEYAREVFEDIPFSGLMIDKLRELGQSGWELATLQYFHEDQYCVGIFKRASYEFQELEVDNTVTSLQIYNKGDVEEIAELAANRAIQMLFALQKTAVRGETA